MAFFSIRLTIFLKDKCSSIRTFMHILMKVFDDLLLCATLNIDVCVILHTQITIIWNNSPIINLVAINSNHFAIVSTPISNKPIFFNSCGVNKGLWVVLCAHWSIYTQKIRINYPTWPMYYMLYNGFICKWIFILIRKLGTNEDIDILKASRFIISSRRI